MANVENIAEQLNSANGAGDFYLLKEPLSAEDRVALASQLAKNFDIYLAELEKGNAASFTVGSLASTYSSDNAGTYIDRLAEAFSRAKKKMQTVVLGHNIQDHGLPVATFSDADTARLLTSLPQELAYLEIKQASDADVSSLADRLKDKISLKQVELWFERRLGTKVSADAFNKLLFGLKLNKIEKFGITAPGQGDAHPLFGEKAWFNKGTKVVFNAENDALKAFCQVMNARPIFDKNMGAFSFSDGSAVKEKNVEIPDFSAPLKRFLCGKEVEKSRRERQKEILQNLRGVPLSGVLPQSLGEQNKGVRTEEREATQTTRLLKTVPSKSI